MAVNKRVAEAVALDRIIFPGGGVKADILNALISLLESRPGIKSRDDLSEAIFRREELMSTGIGINLAIPHCRLEGVKDISAAVAVCPDGISDYVSLDGKPVKLVIMIVAGRHQQNEYIQMLSLLSGRLKKEEVRDRLMAARSPEEVFQILTEEEK
jgi:mannitol/fructose-specific phosphotransferase system IIA component (Ntr-type)